ncbi:hypothetical protein ABZP36_022999 [Zizania latifolia]
MSSCRAPASVQAMAAQQQQRHRGESELTMTAAAAAERRLTRLLLNVTVEQSLWPVHVVLGVDCTVADLVRTAVAAYVREGRRPPLPAVAGDPASGFELHLSKYSLESLRPEEKLVDLGSRNFFLCVRRSAS